MANRDLLSPYFNTPEVNNSQEADRVLDALSEMEDLYSWDQQNVTGDVKKVTIMTSL